MGALPPPLTALIRERVGQEVTLLLDGGHTVTGEIYRVADDGQAVRLHDVRNGACFFIDLIRVVAMEVR